MSTSTLDAWFCCLHCKTRFAPFNGLIKELASHRSGEKCWFLFRDNAGLMNVNFEGRKAIDQAPTSVKSVEVRDGGHTTQTDMASMYCSKCSAHVGWKIVKESNNHPIVHQGQYIVQNHIKL
ncbi:uncharacterized protein LOC117915535 [Vitis riparia]|uniref:uncharacterized protein LOC117915535 n=1 Tax=Vitis riparia TaxID=96939 RepID=UPI00155AD098|nr:uncharacterized protein LOC117915535 [Vitis riparia]